MIGSGSFGYNVSGETHNDKSEKNYIINYYAFQSCNKLTSVTIGAGVTSVNFNAFYYCKNLTSLNYLGTMDQWKALDKNETWYYDSIYVTSVICSDGTIALK